MGEQLASFDQQHSANPMFQRARQYMRQVISLLQFQRATIQGDWLLHLASLESLCVYFFAYTRHDYAQDTSEYIAWMNQLKTDNPQTWDNFNAGDFTVSTSNKVLFTRLGVDQAQIHVNKKLKGHGAVNGITQSPRTLLKICLCAQSWRGYQVKLSTSLN